jgi:hypothetical protein
MALPIDTIDTHCNLFAFPKRSPTLIEGTGCLTLSAYRTLLSCSYLSGVSAMRRDTD